MSNAAGFQFRDNYYALAPPWLSTNAAERYEYTMQLLTDCLLEKASEAVTIRLPGIGDNSNLPYLAYDRQLVQGLEESNNAFISRLVNANETWALAGSRVGVMGAIQAYIQGLQPGVAANLPLMRIVGGPGGFGGNSWDTLYQGDAIGKVPSRTTVLPGNFNWDNSSKPWRAWLILYMTILSSGLSGNAAATSTAAPGSLYVAGGTASNHVWGQLTTMLVNGSEQQVWVPNTGGSAVNYPWLTITGMTGLTNADVGSWLLLSGSTHGTNNGAFQILNVLSATSCVIANPNGVASDAGPLTWSVGYFPFLGPAPAFGAPGFTFGQGEAQTPPVDLGSNVGGVWRPTLGGSQPTISWGLQLEYSVIAATTTPAQVLQTIRELLQQWKSAGTFYESIIVATDGSTGVAGSAYSPNSADGRGNPNGTFGQHGSLTTMTVGGVEIGVWVPNRLIASPYDCFVQGTGSWASCTVANVT